MRYDVLISLIRKHKFESMIEIGVGRGDTVKKVTDAFPKLEYTGIDPYTQYDAYRTDINGTFARLVSNEKMSKIALKGKPECVRLVPLFSHMATGFFQDGAIDLVFVDGNHAYEYVQQDLRLYWPKLRKGGIMAGHDYDRKGHPGVKKAVDAFVAYNDLVLQKEQDIYYIIKLK